MYERMYPEIKMEPSVMTLRAVKVCYLLVFQETVCLSLVGSQSLGQCFWLSGPLHHIPDSQGKAACLRTSRNVEEA